MKTVQSVLFFLIIASTCAAQVPILNSYPSAKATVYLDFDGQHVSGTTWNWNGDIDAHPASFTAAEITEMFNRVAEDYSIFDLNITTDSVVYLSAPFAQRIRIIITPSSDWYGRAGGVSFVGSFTWGDDTPAWVFCELLGHNVKYVAEAISHETGHTLGLQHQSLYDGNCRKINEYAPGQGTGEIGWAPIMGVGYYKNLTTWYNGKSAIGCNVLQDDIKTIATGNGFGLRVDDVGDVTDQAQDILLNGTNFNVNGIINTSSDIDMFRINIPFDASLRIIATPRNVGVADAGADVDIKLTLLDAMSDTICSYNPAELLSAGMDTILNAGNYYLVCEGVGNANTGDYGSLGHYNLSGTLSIPLPVHFVKLRGWTNNHLDLLSWSFQSDEPIKEFEVQSSSNGVQFQKLFTVSGSKFSQACAPPAAADSKVYYRIRAVTVENEMAYYSNIISLPPPAHYHAVKLLGSVIHDNIKLSSAAECSYQLMLPNGQLISQGMIYTGLNIVRTPANVKGIFLLRIIHANDVWTEKILKQ